MFVYAMNFWAARNSKKWNFRHFRPNLRELGLFHLYFVCKCSFREISMFKMIILDQNKLIWLIFKNRKSKIYKLCFLFIKMEIRQVYNPFYDQILNHLCSIRFFVRFILRKLSTGGNGGTVLIRSWKCNYSIYMNVQAMSTLLCLLLVLVV